MSNYNQSLIEDYKQTIERLQKECTEKTNAIIALGEQLKAKEQECETLASQLDFEIQKKECLEQECERSLKRISDLEERIINHSNEIEEYCSRLADKNKECEELKEYIQANKATGICETCTHIALIENDRYRKALEEINGLIQSTLDDFEEDSIDQQLEFSKQIGMNILDIINKAKDGE